MEKITMNSNFFDENIPPASVGFEAKTMGMLRSLAAKEAQTAKVGHRPMPRRKLSTVLALGVLITALAATALALGLQWSQRYQMGKTAKEAVMQKYGLTVETMGLFAESTAQDGNTWTFTYRPVLFSSNAIGEYTVVMEGGKEPIVTWSHDDVPKSEGSGFDAEAWGQPQLESALSLHQAQQQSMADTGEPMTLEDMAERDKALLEASEQGLIPFVMHVAPTEKDISPEDAVTLAKEAVFAKFGVPEERLSDAKVYIQFLKYSRDEEPQYRISLVYASGAALDETEELGVSLFSPSGEVVECYWAVDPANRELPSGSLKGQFDAVSEYIREGAFRLLSPTEKAEVAARITEAGYLDLLGFWEYVAPSDADLPEEKARTLSAQAMKDKYGFTDETLTLFLPCMSVQMEAGQRVWVTDYVPNVQDDWGSFYELPERLGSYRVAITADTGTVRSIAWDAQELKEDKAYLKDTWGQAVVYDAHILPWLQELLKAQRPFALEEREVSLLSLEKRSAKDQLFRDAGFPSAQYCNGLPKDGDISEEKALELACQALETEYGLTLEEVKSWPMSTYFFVGDPSQRYWYFWIFPTGDRQGQDFSVEVHAESGTILNITYTAGGNG